jgi:nicotinate-nucleotide adenylyltransferase
MIGIFGGTFDPVHFGHIKPVLSVKQALNLRQIRFIPNSVPPHRDAPWLSAEQRLSLLQSALGEYIDVVVDQRELERDGPSFMIDTLRSLNSDYQDESICLVVGMDAFFGIAQWRQWKQLFELCHLVVTTRPGFDQALILEQVGVENYPFLAEKMTQDIESLKQGNAGKILLQSVPLLDISSTEIRAKLLNGEDVSQLMPDEAHQKLRGFIDEDR